ncbi:MAG: HAD family hydrolase [Proteobacteria bacterium]|nr:HAD family hydrolase [Pseudomonadota bacterium]
MAQYNDHVLVIFDLISTLTNAGPRYIRAFQAVCEKNGISPLPNEEDLIAMLGNKNLSEITDQFAGSLEKSKKVSFMDSCNQECDAILNRADWHETLYPHVREAAEALHQRGITLGIFTGTREDAMENQIAYHGIADMFETRYRRGKDNARDAGKTSDFLKTEQLSAIVAQFKQDAGNENVVVIVVGDSTADAKAAANLGLSFVGFAENECKKGHLERAGVKIIINYLSDLTDIVDRLHPPSNPTITPHSSPPPKP